MILDENADYDAVLTELAQVMHDQPRAFRGSSLIVDIGGRNLTTDEILELEELVNRQLGTRVLQLVNNEAEEILTEQGDSGRPEADPPKPQPSRQEISTSPRSKEDDSLVRAYVLRRTVRSGQSITYDGSIVILGDVNPGAEVIAGGDVVVIGALRGLVHAGARGRLTACVVALRMDPVQIRIAHLIGRAPDGGSNTYEPEVAYVRNGQIVVESLASRPDSSIGQGGNSLWAERL